MPVAERTTDHLEPTEYEQGRILRRAGQCANCGTPIFAQYASNRQGRTYHHFYPEPFFGQMTCDPQQARAALKGKA